MREQIHALTKALRTRRDAAPPESSAERDALNEALSHLRATERCFDEADAFARRKAAAS